MTANSLEELRRMMLLEAEKAMRIASEKALADMYEETGKFYTGRVPEKYQRTGALGDTPNVTSTTRESFGNLDQVYFEAYLDQKHHYTTGDKPNMDVVLELANYGKPWTTKNNKLAKPTVGKKGFWERAEKKMERDFEKTLKRYFR